MLTHALRLGILLLTLVLASSAAAIPLSNVFAFNGRLGDVRDMDPPAVHELGRLTIGDVSGGGPVAGAAFLARSNDRNDTLAALGFSSPYLPDLSLSPAATRPPKEAFFTSFFDSTLASELGGMGDGTIHAIDRDATAGDGDTAGIRDACIGSASPTCAGPGGFTW